MSYEAECPCGARLQVGDHAVGKRIKCPRCGELIFISNREIEEEEIPVVSLEPTPAVETKSSGDRTPCPYCAELVLTHARICPCCQSPLGVGPEITCMNCKSVNSAQITECRNCGKNMIPAQQPVSSPPIQVPQAAAVASKQNTLSILDWIFGIFLPFIGIIMGIFYLTSGRGSRGWQIMGLSIIGLVLRFGCYGSNVLN